MKDIRDFDPKPKLNPYDWEGVNTVEIYTHKALKRHDPITQIVVDLNARRIKTDEAIAKLKEICNG